MIIRRFIHIFILLSWIVLISSCSSHKKITGEPVSTEHIGKIHLKAADNLHQHIIEESLTWLGTPYKYAGSSKEDGTDCSGMVLRIYEDITAHKLPRNSAAQAEHCIPLSENDVEGGDLVFFATGKDPDKISHVGIIIDSERFIHSSTSKGVVISNLYTPYYQKTFRMFGRVPYKK